MTEKYVCVMVSGGFDPIHEGHLDLLHAASQYGPVCVALNSDAWLVRKKGFAFHTWHTRRRILEAMRHRVTFVEDADGTVCEAIRRIRPFYFANGGDRTEPNSAEHTVCKELGIVELFNVGGGKVQSSSELVRRIGK